MDVRRAFGALVIVQVLYALLPAAGKTVFLDMDPVAMTSLRVLGAASVYVALHIAAGRPWPRRAEWTGVGLLAVLGIVVNMLLFAIGLQWTHPVNATLIITIIPVATYLTAVVLGRETIGPRRLGGILLALSGAVYLIGLSGFEADRQSMVGDILTFVNAVSFSVYLVFSKSWAERHGAHALTAWLFVAASILFLPLAILTGAPDQLATARPATWGWMAFIVLGPTVGAYLLNNEAIRHVTSSTVAVFIYLQTPVSALAAWLILDTLPSPRIIPAALLILAGVGIVARFRDQAPATPRPAPGSPPV